MGDSQFAALSLDNNPWMKYFSPASGADITELSVKSRGHGATVHQSPPPSAAVAPPPVVRTQSGRLMRHTSAPNRLNTPPGSPDRSSGDSRRSKAEAPAAADSAPPAAQPSSAPRLQKKPSNPLLAKQKMFASKAMNTQSAPNLSMGIESELSQQSLYKTELCRSFEETGSCRYGTKCQFAHGKSELRPVIRHPKYKTEVCKTWQAHGSCPYGTRCRFIHNDGSFPSAAPVAPTPTVPVSDPLRTPVSPSQSSSPGPRLAIFADIIGESSAQ